ncbi:oxidoreductase [Xylaria intraflava]|nr:oxidoreductase [Xylaria intraflava]
METNYAAFQVRSKRKPFDVDEAEDRFPDEDEIVIQNVSVSVNPIDNALQDGYVQNMTYPTILGADVAGEVVMVGSQVNRFSEGDRVMGHALRLATQDDRHAGFQLYTVLLANMACPIPPELSYEDASTLPLGISTAAAALFQKTTLALEPPVTFPPARDEWVIIGGATGNVGSHGVRLASAAGYKVLALAGTSADSVNLVKNKLGAAEVVDSRLKAGPLADKLVAVLSGKTIAGAFDASGFPDPITGIANAVSRLQGAKTVALVSDDYQGSDIPRNVDMKLIQAIDIRNNEVGNMVWADFLPDALATGKYFVPYPKARVFGNGLRQVQGAIEAKKGSGEKSVVTLN